MVIPLIEYMTGQLPQGGTTRPGVELEFLFSGGLCGSLSTCWVVVFEIWANQQVIFETPEKVFNNVFRVSMSFRFQYLARFPGPGSPSAPLRWAKLSAPCTGSESCRRTSRQTWITTTWDLNDGGRPWEGYPLNKNGTRYPSAAPKKMMV